MMKKIPLTQGQYAVVDDADYGWLNRDKWYAYKRWHTFYAMRHVRVDGKEHRPGMHRLILGLTPGDGKETDHIDGNGLNNQRANLRICSKAENQHNRRRQGGSSQYKGVCRSQVWRAQISFNGQKKHLGSFNSEIEAALAYNRAAKELFGEYARLNDIAEGGASE